MEEKIPSRPKQRALFLIGVAAFFATLIANAPASLIGSFAGAVNLPVAYSDAKGTLWNGSLSDGAWAGIGLGDIQFKLSFWSLFRLQPEANIRSAGGAVTGQGRVSIGAGGYIKLTGLDADISLSSVAPRGVFGEPATGRATIAIERLEFSRRRGCVRAAGEIWTNVLDAPAQRFSLPKLPMSGTVGCDNEQLVMSLEGQNARAGANVLVKVDKSFTYEIIATASPVEENIASALRVFGFEDDNGGLTYGSAGVLTGAGS